MAYSRRFLWVKFQLLALRDMTTDDQIRSTLRDLPRDLPQTFERILSQCQKLDDMGVGRSIFRWIAAAKRPLSLDELRGATAIKPLQENWSADLSINNMKKAMAFCGNLIFVDEEHQQVHFTHGSVRQYLLSDTVDEPLSQYRINLEDADAEVGAICVTYLNFSIFNTQMTSTKTAEVKPQEITTMVIKRALPPGIGNKIALRLLRLPQKSDKSVHRLIEEKHW